MTKEIKLPISVAGKMQMIVDLLAEPEECECERCGDTHMTAGGLFPELPKEEKEKLIKELIAAPNQK